MEGDYLWSMEIWVKRVEYRIRIGQLRQRRS